MFPHILERLITSGRPFTRTIVGDGPELKRLRQTMISRSAEQKVLFTCHVSYRRVPELLADSDVFLLTSAYEGLPLSLLKAPALGVVPVASDVDGGVREAIEPGIGV